MPAAQCSTEIDAAPDQVMEVLTDFASYPRFLPDLQVEEVLRRRPGEWEVRFGLQLIRPLSYRLRLVQRGPLALDWSLLEGVFRSNEGGWTLEPLEGGRRTRATYRIDVQVDLYVPANLIRALVDRSLPDTLMRFKDEIERRARAG